MAGIPQRKEREDSLIVILGPTASGKSDLGVRLAKAFEGEIISADSRQVYKGLDIGTGKIRKKEMQGVAHHLLDVSSLAKPYTVSAWRQATLKAIALIRKRGNIPFLVGGSPLYIYALVDQWSIPEVRPDAKLRKRLERLSLSALLTKLARLDPARASSIDPQNKRRIIRAIEIVSKTKGPVPSLQKRQLPYPILFLGIAQSKGLSWKRIDELGFEYKYATMYLKGEKRPAEAKFGKAVGMADGAEAGAFSKKEMRQKIQKSTEDFARRQMSWFKKDQRIHWVKNYKEARWHVSRFLS